MGKSKVASFAAYSGLTVFFDTGVWCLVERTVTATKLERGIQNQKLRDGGGCGIGERRSARDECSRDSRIARPSPVFRGNVLASDDLHSKKYNGSFSLSR
jgi:hypothetical protein